MTPFVLLGRKKLRPEEPPSTEDIYDFDRQLWVDKSSGIPLVLRLTEHAQPSQYGETTMTETREGVDQTEGTALIDQQFGRTNCGQEAEIRAGNLIRASRFGETTHTATKEGVDQTEGSVFQASPFGETIMTKTREGADQTEGASCFRSSQYGETIQTRTREGVDQTEVAAFCESPNSVTSGLNLRGDVARKHRSSVDKIRCSSF